MTTSLRRRRELEEERQRIAEYEADGFVPYGAWRSAEARLDSMEHAMRAKIRVGATITTITRRTPLPAWAR
jgi:hypothetical protein